MRIERFTQKAQEAVLSAQQLAEAYRSLVFSTRTPHSVGTDLVDGSVAGSWRTQQSGNRTTLSYTLFERLPAAADREVRDEAGRLVRIMESEAASHTIERRTAD